MNHSDLRSDSFKANDSEISFEGFGEKLRNVSYMLVNYKVYIFCGTLAGLIIGVTFGLSKKPVYMAEYTFVINDGNSNSASKAMIAQTLGLNLFGGNSGGFFQPDNIGDLLKSKLIIFKCLRKKAKMNGQLDFLVNHYLDIYKLRNEWNDTSRLYKYRFDGDTIRNRVLYNTLFDIVKSEVVNRNLIIEKEKKSSLNSLKIVSRSETFSKIFADALIQDLIDLYVQTRVGKQRQTVVQLQHRTDSVKVLLLSTMRGFAYNEDRNLNVVRQEAKVSSRAQELNISLLQSVYTELVRNLEAQKLSLVNDTPLIQIVDRPDYPLVVSSPSWLKALITGAIAGLILSVLAVGTHSVLIKVFK